MIINSSRPRGAHDAPYGFVYTGSGLFLGAQIWSALESPRFWLLKARAYERVGAIDKAGQAYSAAVNVSNNDPAIGLDYAQFLERRGKTTDA